MPRSSRHKSSKHSSKEAKEYSDSEKDSGVKDRKGKAEESGGVRVSKDSSSSEKRKVDSKDGKDLYGGSGNGDYSEDYSSSKRRKERVDDRASDRWNGGEDDHRSGGGGGEGSKKSSKASADSKSKRRDESMGMYEEAEEVKKSSSSGKGEGRHRDRDRDRDRDSGRKEGRDGGVERDRDKERDRDRKSKERRSERLVGGDEHRSAGKQVVENSDLNAECESGSPEADSQLDRRMRKRRDSSIDMGKHQDDVGDISDRRLSSRDDIGKDVKQKDERRKEERYKEDRYREKHREDVDRDSKHRDDRQKEERSTKDHLGSKSEDKHVRDEKDTAEMQSKTSKLHDGERKGENDRDRDRDRHRDLNPIRDRDRDRHHDREREHERERTRDRDYDRDHEWDWDGDRDRDRDRERNRERERERDRDRDRDQDRDYDRGRHDFDRDYGSSHLDDRTTRYKDSSRAKRRSPDDRDDLTDIPSRGSKARYSDVEKKSVSGDRTESDANKRRSHSRQTHVDMSASNDKQRNSPSSSPHVGLDESRYLNPEDLKYRDSTAEQRSRAVPSKDASGFSGALERGSKHRSMEKSSKMDDATLGELSNEKSSSSKASPLGLIERSPSSSSIDRRYMNRTGARRSLDIEETGWRSTASIDNRDFDDRLSRDLPSEKPLVDESSPVDSSFYNRNNQANTSSIPHPAFRAGVDSPFVGSLEDDSRVNSSSRYRRSGDPNMGRGHNNTWRGVPNWTSPLPNGFIPFQHGPPGTFQGIMPQFPGPIFGVRPSLDINHSGMPYHIPDADRFSSHLRPPGWQNMMDATGPSHLHGWDGSNGVFRDEPHLFGAAEWEQSRHPMNTRGRESSVDTWKGQNGDAKRDLLSPSHKDDYPVQASVDGASAVQAGQMSNHEDNHEHGNQGKLSETRSGVTSSAEESTPKVIHEKKLESSKSSKGDASCLSRYYLSKLDISAELACPELYNQCMSLLDIDQSETTDEETIRLITSKDYLRAGAKSSKTSWISSHFPSIKDSVFQRAMNLYRKERIEAGGIPFLSKRTLDIVSKPKKENVEEQIHGDEEKVDDPVPTSDTEMVDALNTGLDVENVEAVSLVAVDEKMEVEVISIPCHEEQNHNCSRSPKLEVLVKDDFPDNLGETLATSNGVEAEAISSEVVKSEDTTADGIASLDNASLPVAPLSSEGDKLNRIGEANGGHCVNHVEEGMAFSDGLNGRVLVPDDGSPKDSEAVMSGSNESESVNLSRIHHSPESTH